MTRLGLVNCCHRSSISVWGLQPIIRWRQVIYELLLRKVSRVRWRGVWLSLLLYLLNLEYEWRLWGKRKEGGRATETEEGPWRSKRRGKHEEETKVRRNLRVHRGVRGISLFTVNIIISNLGTGAGSDRLSSLLEGHQPSDRTSIQTFDCVIPKSKLSNAAPHTALFISVFPVLHILNDQLVVIGLIIQFMVQWISDKLALCLLESCCPFWGGLAVCLSWRTIDIYEFLCASLSLMHVCARAAGERVGVKGFSHEYLQSCVHSSASAISSQPRWRQKLKGEKFIRKSLFVQ